MKYIVLNIVVCHTVPMKYIVLNIYRNLYDISLIGVSIEIIPLAKETKQKNIMELHQTKTFCMA